MDFAYYDLQRKTASGDIAALFPGFAPGEEALAVLSPHDDDALIGASYAMRAAMAHGAPVYVLIACRGNLGYTDSALRDAIEEIRQKETDAAYACVGLEPGHIGRLNISDFSLGAHAEYLLPGDQPGTLKAVVTFLRKRKITRLLIPNGYREHSDHTALNKIGVFDAPQAGDPIVPDWAMPQRVKTVAEYSVWADFSPEDMLVAGREKDLRANRLVCADGEVEDAVRRGLAAYKSQGDIISDLVASREARKTARGLYLEPYLVLDPRPKIDLKPYVGAADEIDGKREKRA